MMFLDETTLVVWRDTKTVAPGQTAFHNEGLQCRHGQANACKIKAPHRFGISSAIVVGSKSVFRFMKIEKQSWKRIPHTN